jgi:hypothetical protein
MLIFWAGIVSLLSGTKMMGIGFQGIATACITLDLSDNPFVQKNRWSA